MGVLTPSEIKAIRERYGFSRRAFARVTGFGESTLERWEHGDKVQQPANDRFLRLLRELPLAFGVLREMGEDGRRRGG